jgi:rare lipoprotein A
MVRVLKYFILLIIIINPLFSFSQQGGKTPIKDKKATYYHNNFVNRKTSSGEIFVQTKYTAAHKTLPLNTLVRVINKKNGRSVLVRVNDRCPKKGVIDLSLIAAKRLRMIKDGVTPVKVEVLSNDYLDIWEKQDEIFNMFDRAKEKDSVLNSYFDSIIFSKENAIQSSLLFTTYIRLSTTENRTQAKKIIDQLPERYRYITKAVTAENKKFYHINIGPFISSQTAEEVIEELKGKYPKIYILENKNEE